MCNKLYQIQMIRVQLLIVLYLGHLSIRRIICVVLSSREKATGEQVARPLTADRVRLAVTEREAINLPCL